MLSWSLLTGAAAVFWWPELLHQCRSSGYYKVHWPCRQEECAPLVTSCPLGALSGTTVTHRTFLFSLLFSYPSTQGHSHILGVQTLKTTRNCTGKPRVLHLKRKSIGWRNQPLKNTTGTEKTQHVSRLSWMALFNAGEEAKIEISKTASSDISLQKRSHSMLLRCPLPKASAEPVLPLQPLLLELSASWADGLYSRVGCKWQQQNS